MIRGILVLSLLLGTALAPGAALAEGGASGVTPIQVEEGKATEVTGNIKAGKKIPLEWAEKSSVACFPGTRFEMFDGNHVFYRTTLPAGKQIKIQLEPSDKSKTINLYALRQSAGDNQPVPPNVESAISAEASYPIYAKRGGKVIKNADDGVRKIDFISVNSPYSILIGVAGAKGATDGEYKLSVDIGPRK